MVELGKDTVRVPIEYFFPRQGLGSVSDAESEGPRGSHKDPPPAQPDSWPLVIC